MKTALIKNVLIGFAVIGILSLGIAAFATNVSPVHHPNLAAAQVLIDKAIAKVHAAQVANEFDMEGHAAKGIALLDQASAEIKLAAQAANAHR